MAAVELPGAAPIRGRQGHNEPSWYQPDLSNLSASTLQFFQEYVGLKSEKEVIQHIKAVRQKAWEIVPYPCIGLFAFLDFIIQLSPIYPSVVSRVRAGQTLLDLGCCFGQNIRKLAFDAGLPCSKNLMGVDIDVRFIDLGYDLFRDRDRLGAEFCFGDILDEAFLAEKRGGIDMIYLGNFLHLFGIEQQKSIVRKLMALLAPRPGSLVFGLQLGGDVGGEVRLEKMGSTLYKHSPISFRQMWLAAADGEWDIQCTMERKNQGGDGAGQTNLGFEPLQLLFSAVRL